VSALVVGITDSVIEISRTVFSDNDMFTVRSMFVLISYMDRT
jgi:hypothetical protein